MNIKKTISQIIGGTAAILLLVNGAIAGQKFASDQGHTEVLFGWSHAGVSRQHGEFTVARGTLDLENNIENSKVNMVIDTNSLASGFAKLDDHLKSKDYFDAAKYPEITFQSTAIKQTGDKSFNVSGNLTIHGVTKPITLKAEMTHRGKHPVAKFFDHYKGEWIAFKATGELNNMDFKVGKFPTGPITIEINTEMKAK